LAVKDKKRRLFFALWPTARVREAIVDMSSPFLHEMAGRIIRPQNLHITLHFIGSVSSDKKDCLHKAAQSVIASSFNLCLDGLGHFSKAKIFWMAAQNFPPGLSSLHQNLGEALAACDFHGDQRVYSPHVSLMRKFKERSINYPEFSISWQVDEFVLVESCSGAGGVNYKVIERYPLQGQ